MAKKLIMHAAAVYYNYNTWFRFIDLVEFIEIESVSVDSALDDQVSLTVTEDGNIDFITIDRQNKIKGQDHVKDISFVKSYEYYYDLMEKQYKFFTGKPLDYFFEGFDEITYR